MSHRLLFCVLALVLGACGASSASGSTASTGGEGGAPTVKKVALSWGVQPVGGSADVFLAVTDEIGRTTSHPLGRFEGQCTVISTGRPSTGAVTAVLCKRGDVGVELDAIPRPGVVIVLKLPYVAGADPDPLTGEEVAHVAVPVGATIESSN